VWHAAFEAAARSTDERHGGLVPAWHYPGDAAIQRFILSFPLSRDEQRWDNLRQTLALYRLAYGQPRQDDMVELLRLRGLDHDADRVQELRLDLTPR
jgi:hypothetical protein